MTIDNIEIHYDMDLWIPLRSDPPIVAFFKSRGFDFWGSGTAGDVRDLGFLANRQTKLNQESFDQLLQDFYKEFPQFNEINCEVEWEVRDDVEYLTGGE